MSDFDRTNTGLLSRNDRKEKDTHPDFKGFCDIEGTEYWISGWIKEGGPNSKAPGRKFFSLSFQPKEQQFSSAQPQPTQTTGAADLDEDLPFANPYKRIEYCVV